MSGPFLVLLFSTISVAFVHALAPDHWVPFVAIGRAQKWSRKRLFWITTVSGIGHVGSSILLGSLGIVLGVSLSHLRGWEGSRAQVAGVLLVGFGVAYALWGLKRAARHSHQHLDGRRLVSVMTLIAVFVLGPCEPLIPLMFLATAYGNVSVALIASFFSAVTIGTMLGTVFLAHRGAEIFKAEVWHRYTEAIAGGVIALTGLVVMAFGI